MCGIAGILSPEGINPDDLYRMSQTIAHRGPDGDGFVFFSEQIALPRASKDTASTCIAQNLAWSPSDSNPQVPFRPDVGFMHRRLAIIDLEATGHQPMCSVDKRYWITFNGEIYNYIELREELEKLGAVFITRSDTEVILQAYQHWGEACLHRFNGMWAFGIYDTINQTFFASRDRFGVKPFYYHHTGKILAFASEQKALLGLNWVPLEVNPDAVFDYFVFSQIEYQPQGFLKGIDELPAGCLLHYQVKTGQCQVKTWYTLDVNHENETWSKSQHQLHTETIRELLSDAVRLRLRADVPVGSCLSGGLDSSALVGWMRKHLGAEIPIHVYTAVFPGNRVDEGHWADKMAQSINATSHHVQPDSETLIRDLEDLTYCQDIPIWSTSTYAQYRVMQLVKESGIKVVLDGQGGDELFGGYEPHRSFFWQGLSVMDMIRDMQQGMNLRSGLKFHAHQQARYDLAFRMPVSLSSRFYQSYFQENSYLDKDFFNQHIQRFALQRQYRTDDLNGRLALEMQNTTLKGYLKCEDRCAMWHGIESRTPFADDLPLIEYLFSVPAVYKMHGSRLKALLRDASTSVLPEAIKNRTDKQGYTTPNNEWIKKIAPHFQEQFNQVLAPFLQVDKIKNEYSNLFNPTGDADTGRVFKFISFAVWIQKLAQLKA